MALHLKYKDHEAVLAEREAGGVPYLSFPLLAGTGLVRHLFTTRLGGVSGGIWASMNTSYTRGDEPAAVTENRRRLARIMGLAATDLVTAEQTHTTNVAVVTATDAGQRFANTDGLITNVPGLGLMTFFADCVPLYFVDPVRRAIGLAHSGWRGTVAGMGAVTVKRMGEAFGSRPADLIAAIGPSICQDCYEVSEDVIREVQQAFPAAVWPALFRAKADGKYQLDLWQANRHILTAAGIKEANIAVTNVCTCCNPEILFSHRASHGRRGNLSALLALK